MPHTGINWAGRPALKLVTDIYNGPGPASTHEAAAAWRGLAAGLAAADAEFTDVTRFAMGNWEGPAAESASAALIPFGEWARAAEAVANHLAAETDFQGDAYTATKHAMPTPAEVVQVEAVKDNPVDKVVGLLTGVPTPAEVAEGVAAAQHAQAAMAMASYDVTASTFNTYEPFQPAPVLTTGVISGGGPSGAAAGYGDFGSGAAQYYASTMTGGAGYHSTGGSAGAGAGGQSAGTTGTHAAAAAGGGSPTSASGATGLSSGPHTPGMHPAAAAAGFGGAGAAVLGAGRIGGRTSGPGTPGAVNPGVPHPGGVELSGGQLRTGSSAAGFAAASDAVPAADSAGRSSVLPRGAGGAAAGQESSALARGRAGGLAGGSTGAQSGATATSAESSVRGTLSPGGTSGSGASGDALGARGVGGAAGASAPGGRSGLGNGAGAGRAHGEDDDEHDIPDYLKDLEHFTDGRVVAPPVIGVDDGS